MKLYLDDDMAAPLLARLLRNAGHDVLIASRALGVQVTRMRSTFDTLPWTDRTIITGNHDDFEDLHELVIDLGGHHPGILAVRKDNDLKAAT